MALINLQNAHDQPLSLVGGKAAALGRLLAYGAPVPPGFVISPELDLSAATNQILAAFDALHAPFVAVRSSATGEDGQGQSWAGQFESYLYTQRADLLARVQDCRDSGASPRAQAYDDAHSGMPVAVIVQTMLAPDSSGVLFTTNPITKNSGEVMVEAVYGLGEALVQGLVTPDNYLLNKKTGQILNQTIAEKTVMLVGEKAGLKERPVAANLQTQPALSPAQLAQLTQLSAQLEAKFGHPLDIEWVYAQGRLYLVQGRPITTL